MKLVSRRLILALLAVLLITGSWWIHCLRSGRVSLQVQNAPLSTVIRSLRWQTWEKIIVPPGATGLVTLNVRNIPLAEALDLVAQQTDCQWMMLYPLYSSRSSCQNLERKLSAGEKSLSTWTNLHDALMPSPGLTFARNANPNELMVNLRLQNKSLLEVARALSRFKRARIVPEDTAKAKVSINFVDAPFEEAVYQLAELADCSIARYYLLEPFFPNGHPNSPQVPRRDLPLSTGSDQFVPLLNGTAPVTIPLGSSPLFPLPPPDGPPPDPVELQRAMNERMREDLRVTTPEQRAARWRQASRVPPPPPLPSNR